MKDPKVTVLMSVYNGEKYLREAVDSILNQTFRDFEFLIINDCSTDRTAEIMQSYNDPRIKIISNEKNIGLTKSLNKGLRIARGEYIARQDADDVSMPERLEKEVNFLDAHQDHAVVGTFMKILNEDSEVISHLERPVENADIQEIIKRDNCIPHGSVMIRKTYLQNVGFYDESMVNAQDYDLWLRLSKKYCLANLPEYLYMWRWRSENTEAKYLGKQRIFMVLSMIKNNSLDVEQAAEQFINLIVENDIVPKYKPLTIAFVFISVLTFNKIKYSTPYKILYRIRFSRKINKVLEDFKMKKISCEEAKLSLKEIINIR